MRFFTFWTAFDFRFFVIIKKERFPHSTECFEKYSLLMIKKVGGLEILKKVKTFCNMAKTDLYFQQKRSTFEKLDFELNFPRITFFSLMAVFCCNTKLVEKSPFNFFQNHKSTYFFLSLKDCIFQKTLYYEGNVPF